MANDQPYLPSPEIDERAIAREMMHDPYSKHWKACSNFVRSRVYTKAKGIPIDQHGDISQEAMYRVMKWLPHFRFESTLKSWVNIIVEHTIVDMHRRLRNEETLHIPVIDQASESDHEGEEATIGEVKSAEDAFMMNDEIHAGWEACLEYARTHANADRNLLVIWLVIHEGRSYAEAAKAAGCSEAVAGYVVREAQLYARKLRDRRSRAR